MDEGFVCVVGCEDGRWKLLRKKGIICIRDIVDKVLKKESVLLSEWFDC